MRYLLLVLFLCTCQPVLAQSCARYLELDQAEEALTEDERLELAFSDQETSGWLYLQAEHELKDSPEWVAVEILRRRIKALYQKLGTGRRSFSSIRVPLVLQKQCEKTPEQLLAKVLAGLLDDEIEALHQEVERLEHKIEQQELPALTR